MPRTYRDVGAFVSLKQVHLRGSPAFMVSIDADTVGRLARRAPTCEWSRRYRVWTVGLSLQLA